MHSTESLLTGSFLSTVVVSISLGTPFVIAGIKRLLTSSSKPDTVSLTEGSKRRLKSVVSSIKKSSKVKDDNLWNDAIFFPSVPDDPNSSMNKLLFYLQEAEFSLKICVMTLTYGPIYEILIQKHQKGVQVFIFTSVNTVKGKGQRLRAKGIQVRSREKSDYHTDMHNKYALVDDEAVLTGSMNWTAMSIFENRENIVVTTNEEIVSKFSIHFDFMWNDFWDEDADPVANGIDWTNSDQ